MHLTIVTIFPEYFDSALGLGVLSRARREGLVEISCVDPREFATDKHRQVDDYAFGGGAGMVMKPEPLFAAIRRIRETHDGVKVFTLSPGGERFDDAMAQRLSKLPAVALVCGRYEGIDQRVIDHACDGEISLGDFVLTGGEPAALAIVDAVARQIPGVVGKEENVETDSHRAGLKHPVYTRPEVFEGHGVPEVLLSGDEAKVEAWRRDAALDRTMRQRPEQILFAARHRLALRFAGGDVEAAIAQALIARDRVAAAMYVGGTSLDRAKFREAGDAHQSANTTQDGERKLLKSLGEFDTILVGSFGDDRALFEAVRSSLIAGRAVVMHIDDASDDDTALRLDRLFRPRFGEDGI
ncbi:MAG: tRNA (guanosine(37)-N1)-methyltransferase TrmD [Deltaproteobacteria bacterium]|nr:tRNA (guanosine(37)-N1)-methyltransferase TrmD [Deltaproteobacteria bacterium]